MIFDKYRRFAGFADQLYSLIYLKLFKNTILLAWHDICHDTGYDDIDLDLDKPNSTIDILERFMRKMPGQDMPQQIVFL